MSEADVAAFVEAGLYDPAAADAEHRLELLRFLAGYGATVDEMAAADAAGRLAGLPGDRLIRPGRKLTPTELSERCGLPVETLLRMWRALGFPDSGDDTPIATEDEADLFPLFAVASGLFGEDVALEMIRVMASSIARIAEAEVTATLINVPNVFRVDAKDQLAAAQTYVQLNSLLPQIARVLDVIHRIQLQAAIHRVELVYPQGAQPTDAVPMAVAFVDLVGFTPLSAAVATRDLAAAVGEFEATASVLAGEGDGRLVKVIGDEVMLVTPTAPAACAAAVGLMHRFADHPVLPAMRGGVAFGPVLPHEGDYFGPVVNLAARLVALADPGSVLVGPAVAASLAGDDRYSVAPAGTRTVKGFGEPVETHRVSGAETGRFRS